MNLTGDFCSFVLPLTGIDPARVVGDPDIAGGFSGRDCFVGGSDNPGLKYLLESRDLLASDWPLVLFGPSGTGKTAVAISVANRISENSPGKCLVLAARDFARRFAHGLETDSIDQLRQLVVDSNGVLLDDIDQLSSFPAAQSELASLLDQLAIRSVPVIVTAGTRWLDPGYLIPKLYSRLTAGLCLAVNPPDIEARKIIIVDLARQFDLRLTEDVRNHLAQTLTVTWPLIQSFLAQLNNWMLANSIEADTVDMILVSRFLDQLGNQSDRQSVDSILRMVGKRFRIRVADIKSDSRKQSTVLARSVVVYFLRRHLKMSFANIGSVLGGRDHSTIMHSLGRIEELLTEDEQIASMVDAMVRTLVVKELMGGVHACE